MKKNHFLKKHHFNAQSNTILTVMGTGGTDKFDFKSHNPDGGRQLTQAPIRLRNTDLPEPLPVVPVP